MIFKCLKQQHLVEEIYGGIITLDDALEKQIKLKHEIDRFKESTRLKVLEKKEQKVLTFNNTIRLFEGKQKVLNSFESKIFPIEKQAQGKGLKLLTLKQMLQRLSMAFAEIKTSNTSENLQNEIHQILYSFHRAKEVTKKHMTMQ